MASYIIYVDESGDHGLTSIDPQYPIFVLAFCIFRQDAYIDQVTPALQRLKFRYFGHDMVILHEREIRRQRPPFNFLRADRELREAFMEDLSGVVADADFTLIASVIDKRGLTEEYVFPSNPYDLAMAFGLERAALHLADRAEGVTCVVMESRGASEDQAAELEFRRVCDGANFLGGALSFHPRIVSKEVNSTGLQLADLVARPIGRHVLDPGQPNRAYDVIQAKFRRNPVTGNARGWGIKVFP